MSNIIRERFLRATTLSEEYIADQKQWSWWQHWVVMHLSPKIYIKSAFVSGYLWAKNDKDAEQIVMNEQTKESEMEKLKTLTVENLAEDICVLSAEIKRLNFWIIFILVGSITTTVLDIAWAIYK